VKNYNAATYGERIADDYDEHYGSLDATAAVTVLADLAKTGRALELGIGTGRIALPLAARGIEVVGIDSSESMVARLRAKPGGADIPVTIADFTDVDVAGTFTLAFVAFNTFFALPSQEAQTCCFRNVAAHLEPGGLFVIEAFVPDPARFVQGQTLRTAQVETDSVMIEATQHDRNGQRLSTQMVTITEHGISMVPIHLRYAWPSELDLMAKLAGMKLRERWSGWSRQPFTAASGQHVSVYELTTPNA
jgi:SAM-dependent methyltransferase